MEKLMMKLFFILSNWWNIFFLRENIHMLFFFLILKKHGILQDSLLNLTTYSIVLKMHARFLFEDMKLCLCVYVWFRYKKNYIQIRNVYILIGSMVKRNHANQNRYIFNVSNWRDSFSGFFSSLFDHSFMHKAKFSLKLIVDGVFVLFRL